MKEKSTCLSGAAHARATQLLGLEKALMTREGTSRLSLQRWLTEYVRAGFYTKMLLASAIRTMANHSLKYYQLSADGELKFLFSEERKMGTLSGDGKTLESSPRPQEDTDWHGELWTRNLCEWTGIQGLSLKDEGVSSLSAILEVGNVPQRYFLTKKACMGILSRAEKRGKELPADLKLALLEVVNRK
jgi:hypothetical protein